MGTLNPDGLHYKKEKKNTCTMKTQQAAGEIGRVNVYAVLFTRVGVLDKKVPSTILRPLQWETVVTNDKCI